MIITTVDEKVAMENVDPETMDKATITMAATRPSMKAVVIITTTTRISPDLL
jgi:hypothetical protein